MAALMIGSRHGAGLDSEKPRLRCEEDWRMEEMGLQKAAPKKVKPHKNGRSAILGRTDAMNG